MKRRSEKILSAVISITMLVSCIVMPVKARENALTVTTDGIYELYNYVTASTKNAVGDVTYKWMYSDSEDGEYKELATGLPVVERSGAEDGDVIKEGTYSLISDDGATIQLLQGAESILGANLPLYNHIQSGFDWTMTYLAKGDFSGEDAVTNKYVKVVATDEDGNTGESTPVKVGGTFGDTPGNDNWENNLGFSTEYTGKDDFIIDGKSFTLLDTNENSTKSRYLIIANDTYGENNYDGAYIASWGGFTMMQAPQTIAHKVAVDLTADYGTHKLPQTILDNVDYDHMWPYEATLSGKAQNIYNGVVYEGVTVPSTTEMKKYGKKIKGLTDTTVSLFQALRSPHGGNAEGIWMSYIYTDGYQPGSYVISPVHFQSTAPIRPIFWVGEDFFSNARIPLKDMGANIIVHLFDRYGVDGLEEMGYDMADLEDFTGGTISDVQIIGDGELGSELRVDYTNNGAVTDFIELKWMYSEEEDGVYKEIPGENSDVYTCTDKYSNVWVKAVIKWGLVNQAESEPIFILNPWDEDFEGTVKSIKIKGVYESFQSLKAEYTLDDVTTENDIVYKNWYMSTRRDEGYEIIENAGDVLKTNSSYCDHYIKYGITLKNKDEFYSEPVLIGSAWNAQKGIHTVAGGNYCFDTINQTTPDEYVFEIGGQEFIMLDSFDSDSSAFLIMAKDVYGDRVYYDVENGQLFDELIEWLNNEFYVSGNNGKKLPKEVLSYIDKEQGWKTECRMYLDSGERGYYGGISIPSVTEIERYSERIGLQDGGKSWWTRTPSPSGVGDFNYVQYVPGDAESLGATDASHGKFSSHGIRPIFYISRDYFLDNKLDVTTTGTEVFKELGKVYEKYELRGMYDNKVLEELFGFEDDYLVEIYDLGAMSSTSGSIKVDVKNQKEDKEAYVLVGIYDGSNKLVGTNIKKVTLTTGVKKEIEFEYSNLPEGGGACVVAHILEKRNGVFHPLRSVKKKSMNP